MKVNPFDIITLCYQCRRNFEEAGESNVRRINHDQTVKDKCDLCQQKTGYDYRITPKKRDKTRRRKS